MKFALCFVYTYTQRKVVKKITQLKTFAVKLVFCGKTVNCVLSFTSLL